MKRHLTDNEKALLAMASRVYGDADLPAPKTATINGKEFTVSWHRVNRDCYDNLPTPTVMFKVDGKRVSRKAAFELLA